MSQSLVDQITLDCLMNKTVMEKHVMKQREKQINKQDLNLYHERILQSFKHLLSGEETTSDVKYAFDTFVKISIERFKILDHTEMLQKEYHELDKKDEECDVKEEDDDDEDKYDEDDEDDEDNEEDDEDNKDDKVYTHADHIIMRTVKMDPTLDTFIRKKDKDKDLPLFYFPTQREAHN